MNSKGMTIQSVWLMMLNSLVVGSMLVLTSLGMVGVSPLSGNALPSCTNCVLETVAVGSDPAGLAFAHGQMYISNQASNSVSIINGSTDELEYTVPSITSPLAVAADFANGEIYVTEYSSDQVAVISGATLVSNIPVGRGPDGVAYDSVNGDIYVANQLSDNLSVVNGSSNSVVGEIGIGVEPESVQYDGQDGDIYVATSNSVSVVDTANQSLTREIPVTGCAIGLALGQNESALYVTSGCSNCVDIVNTTSEREIESLPVGISPIGVTHDSRNGFIYVMNEDSGNVSAVNGTQVVGSIALGPPPIGNTNSTSPKPYYSAYDPVTGTIFVTLRETVSVAVLSVASSFPRLSDAVVNPASVSIATGTRAAFAVLLSCTGGPCNYGSTFVWTVAPADLGELNSSSGDSVTFLAADTTGSVALTVNVSLNGVHTSATAFVQIGRPNSDGFLDSAGFLEDLLSAVSLAVALLVVACWVVLLRRRRNRKAPPPRSGPSPERTSPNSECD